MKNYEQIYFEKLINLTYKRCSEDIYTALNTADTKIKGRIFERYLAFLFEGNGYIATVNGGAWDGGADIILSSKRNPNKIIWIIQAKNTLAPLYRNIVVDELIKFEEKSRKKYNCNQYCIISLNGYKDGVSEFKRTNMVLEDFKYISELIENFCNNEQLNVTLPELKPHNRYTYREIDALLQENDRVAVPNATGTGKSYLILQILFKYRNIEKLVLAPTNEINDNLIELAPWCKENTKFYTYSKLSALLRNDKVDNLKAKIIILDELHRAGANNWGKAVNSILHNNKCKVLGFSATPIRFLDNNRDMIEELFNGVSTTPLSLSEAIIRGILPSPIYVSAIYNLDMELDKSIKKVQSLNLSSYDKKIYMERLEKLKEIYDKEYSISNIIAKHLCNTNNLKFIIFCESNKHLYEIRNKVIDWFSKATELNVIDYTSTSKTKNSKENLIAFKNNNSINEVKLLFTISKLNEGIHVKNISGIVMLRNTKSPTIYYQQLGRCLAAENLDNNPLVFDFVDNIDNLELFNFWRSIKNVNTEMNSNRFNLGLKENEIRIAFYEEHNNIIKEFKKIERTISYNWDKYYENLISFKELYGHINVPNNEHYFRLYNWISLQRTLYNKGLLDCENIKLLNELSFTWDINMDKWLSNYRIFQEYNLKNYNNKILYFKIVNDEYAIPIYSELEVDKKIMSWIDRQVVAYRQDKLTKEKKKYFDEELLKIVEKNKWIESSYKIIKFYKYIKKNYEIDGYILKIAPKLDNFINLLNALYGNEEYIEKTVIKALPKSNRYISLNKLNYETWKGCFVINLIERESIDINEYIDELNSVYFEDLFDTYKELMKKWNLENVEFTQNVHK